VKREGEDITRSDLPHELLIDPLQERQQVCSWLLDALSLKEPILAKAKRSFHLSGRRIEMRSDRQGVVSPQRWVHLLLVD